MNDQQQDVDKHDFFRSDRFINDPYPYFDYLRAQAPVLREPHQGICMVTGFDEALEIYNDPDRFSSCMSTSGPFAGCPIPLEGRDRKSVVQGKSVSVRVDLGGRRIIKKKITQV